jgi:hypothetical protein
MITRFKLMCPSGFKSSKTGNIKSQDQMVYHANVFNLKISYLLQIAPKKACTLNLC